MDVSFPHGRPELEGGGLLPGGKVHERMVGVVRGRVVLAEHLCQVVERRLIRTERWCSAGRSGAGLNREHAQIGGQPVRVSPRHVDHEGVRRGGQPQHRDAVEVPEVPSHEDVALRTDLVVHSYVHADGEAQRKPLGDVRGKGIILRPRVVRLQVEPARVDERARRRVPADLDRRHRGEVRLVRQVVLQEQPDRVVELRGVPHLQGDHRQLAERAHVADRDALLVTHAKDRSAHAGAAVPIDDLRIEHKQHVIAGRGDPRPLRGRHGQPGARLAELAHDVALVGIERVRDRAAADQRHTTERPAPARCGS